MAARKKTAKKTTRTSAIKKTTAKRKPTARKATSAKKKSAARKSSTKRTVAKKAVNVTVGKKPFTKSEFVAAVSEHCGLTKKEVGGVLEAISGVIGSHLNKSGPGTFVWSGLMKFKIINKPATKARKGTNPFTGEACVFKAKPASRKVKVQPLRSLKEMAK